jgi:iron complex outermembrane receptor protein
MTSRQYSARPALWHALIGLLVAQVMGQAGYAQTSPDSGIDPSETDYPVVITPTRLRQSLADVPASVTVISGETLRRHGITRIEDALRMVPGMAVSQNSGNTFNISYHGTNTISPRRMNVLVDGMSAYQPAFSRVVWPMLPVALEDIDRIEVIRGPDSSAYGPNSMTAVINILTKHPKDVEPALVSASVGTRRWGDGTVRLARTLGSTSMAVTASAHNDGGMDATRPALTENHDDTRVTRLRLRAQHELADGGSLDLQASHVRTDMDLNVLDASQRSYPDLKATSDQFGLRWNKAMSFNHELQLDLSYGHTDARQRWASCWANVAYAPEMAALFRSNPALVRQLVANLQAGQPTLPSGGSAQDQALIATLVANYLSPFAPVNGLALDCGQINQDGVESRTQVELQDTYVVSDVLRVVTGMGFRSQSVDSKTYFGGTVGNHVQWVFGHAEYRPNAWLTANVGGYGESNSIGNATFSPRMALNAHLSANQTVRAVMSKGTRTPDLFESRADWQYVVSGLSRPIDGASSAPLFAHAVASTNLASEEIWSRELGYMLVLHQVGLTFDARLFDERLKQLISRQLNVLDFDPDNTGHVRLSGAEMQANWAMSSAWSGWLTYSYLLNRDAYPAQETLQYERHSGAGGVSVALSDTWRASLAHYAASGNGLQELGYGRTDLTLTHAFMLGEQSASASLTVAYLSTPAVHNYIDNQSYYTAAFDKRWSIVGQVRIAF